jgi:hypothetical protein
MPQTIVPRADRSFTHVLREVSSGNTGRSARIDISDYPDVTVHVLATGSLSGLQLDVEMGNVDDDVQMQVVGAQITGKALREIPRGVRYVGINLVALAGGNVGVVVHGKGRIR